MFYQLVKKLFVVGRLCFGRFLIYLYNTQNQRDLIYRTSLNKLGDKDNDIFLNIIVTPNPTIADDTLRNITKSTQYYKFFNTTLDIGALM